MWLHGFYTSNLTRKKTKHSCLNLPSVLITTSQVMEEWDGDLAGDGKCYLFYGIKYMGCKIQLKTLHFNVFSICWVTFSLVMREYSYINVFNHLSHIGVQSCV